MKNRLINIGIFVLVFSTLIISLGIFWNVGIYVDEANATPAMIYGRNFWVYMAWLRLGLLGFVTFLLGIKIFKK